MVHVRSRKHRKSHHKLSKTSRIRGTRVRRGGDRKCITCHRPYDRADFNPNKDECKKCERLSLGQASSIRSERHADKAKKEAELARVMAARKSADIKELEAALEKAQKALQEHESK